MNDKLKVADHITEIVQRLQLAGYESYIVGGAIRDLILGRVPKDYDLATSATPEQVKKLFGGRRARIIGRRFKLVHLYHGREIIEISTFRRQPDDPGRPRLKKFANLPEKMIFHDNYYGTAEEDAFRRDFTVNALFYDPVARHIIDYTGMGIKDINAGIVRVIGEPEVRFEEDPVRLMRALKLVGQYDFTLESRSEEALVNSIALLAHASKSRLTLELEKLLSGTYAERIFAAFQRYGLLQVYLPYLDANWHSEHIRYAMRLLAARNRRVMAGKYRNSISLAMACLALPLVESSHGSAPGELWQYCYDKTPELIHQAVKQVLMPHHMIKRLTMSAKKILQLQTLLREDEMAGRVTRAKGYAHARELLAIQHEVNGNLAEVVERWPQQRATTPPAEPRKKSRRRRRRKKPTPHLNG